LELTAEMSRTCYDVLAVGPDATDEEIETAFRRRARETHPDVSDHADATERFRLVARARTTLRDDEKRARYDRLGHDAYAERAWSDEFAATWLAVTDEWVEPHRSARDGATATSESATDCGEGADDGTAVADDAGRQTDGDAAPEWTDDTASTATAAGTTSTADDGTSPRRESATDRTADSDTTDRTTGRSRSATRDRTGTNAAAAAGAGSASVSGSTSRTTADVDDAGLWDAAGASWVDGDRDAGRGDGQGFGIRNVEPTAGGSGVTVARPTETELLFAVALFIGYPFFLFGSVAPAFPLIVNAAMSGLTLILVGYALARPQIGLGVFGGWSVAAPALVALWDVSAGSIVLPVVVGVCWLPFAFALLVAVEFG
jgi:curved DNA-binding protein CbpA